MMRIEQGTGHAIPTIAYDDLDTTDHEEKIVFVAASIPITKALIPEGTF